MDSRPLVRVATAGSVDDGKSTFLGRLLFECGAILTDQYEAIEKASLQTGETEVNLALLTDGLRAERSQKITIDVAYRHFVTERRRFLLADTPGHAQYTRNMFTGASTADVAMLLIDATKGPTVQTYRHAFIVSLLRVPHVVILINKMDLVDYEEAVYEKWVEKVRRYVAKLEFADLRFLPISALKGTNLVSRSERMPWYTGPAVLEYLDSVELSPRQTPVDFRFPIQLAIRPSMDFRGYAGTPVSGSIRVGDEVTAQPGGRTSRVRAISTADGSRQEATTGEPIVIELEDELDLVRGQTLVRTRNPSPVTTAFEGTVCWMSDRKLELNAPIQVLAGTQSQVGNIAELVYRINPETLHREYVSTLELNEIGRLVVQTSSPVCLDLYDRNRATGAFLLVDSVSNETLGAGVVTRILGEAHRENSAGLVLWFTGLSGAGKSTLAQAFSSGRSGVVILDGDALRAGMNSDLGFSEADRTENIRRVAELAKVLVAQGLTVICSLISPMRHQRQLAREIIGEPFREVFVRCSIKRVAARDVKGLYAKAEAGEIPNFTGISASYEPPQTPDLVIDTELGSVADGLEQLRESVSKWTQKT
jgi:bifunctional enzyme CysN/CysC